MKKLSSIFCLAAWLLFYSNRAAAQYYFIDDSYFYSPHVYEAGASLGAMNCLTDLGGNKGIGDNFTKDLNIGKSSFCLGAFFSYTYKSAIGARIEATFGKVMADDQVLKSVPITDMASTRFNRNLNFQSSISEYSLLAEIHPLFILVNWVNRDQTPPRYSPYLLGGIGYYSFNPQASYQGRLIDLQPLRTEGQGFKEYPDREVYRLKQSNIPLGFGLKYEISPIIKLRGEFLYRILSTDYLDDVSKTYIDPELFEKNGITGVDRDNAIILNNRQLRPLSGPGGRRGLPTNNDAFFSANLKVSIVIGAQRAN